mmetsp:Transcript_10721/g.28107  ORF Transcript_10721/g.28107 Transcript_10721/m.28107 type:complete len:260 (-) Transcript_10721:777-1556(-)|eukprot:CAMPEP_0113881080 /NCGR_PEP_ID=MMETSP0780_2-20120614/8161_1 /TAXON_ID=652834 /ORGANISM="Palpitomonas bilix" /LENGTH=259 /DNA_ID=CAMNT_0000867865 /DNA_START=251 /DNA_END=1030 /DNA_ORIENTATION=- /assembly_acc=CAM_ASM_000599
MVAKWALIGGAVVLCLVAFSSYLQLTEKSLRSAAWRGDIDLIDALLSEGHDVNALDDMGNTPIYYAVKSGKIETIEHLLQHGATLIGTANSGGSTVFHWAAASGEDILRTVINIARERYGDDAVRRELDRLNSRGDGPIHLAAVFENPAVVQVLASAGADLTLKSKEGNSALHLASYRGDAHTAESLITAGTPLTVEDDEGRTPYMIATNRTLCQKESCAKVAQLVRLVENREGGGMKKETAKKVADESKENEKKKEEL